MEQPRIKVVLSSTSVIKKWEEPTCSDLPKLINSIRNLKESVNDYLTDLVNKEKGFVDKSEKNIENSDEEEDVGDTISGFIKEANMREEMRNKRKVQTGAKSHKAKRKK